MQKKLQEATFDFNDFVKQMRLMKEWDSGGLIKLIPGMNKMMMEWSRMGKNN